MLLRVGAFLMALVACCGLRQPLGGRIGRAQDFSSSVARSSVVRLDTEDEIADLNWLHTQLQIALDREDYVEAASVRDRIRRCADISGGITSEAAWTNLGVPDWLADRLERLNFPLPTRVQLHSLRAAERGDDSAICAPTGSGKTLSYLLPMLTQLSDDLLSEDLSNYLATFLDGGRRASTKGTQRRRAAADTVEDGVTDTAVPTPAVLIVVPTRELGVQVCALPACLSTALAQGAGEGCSLTCIPRQGQFQSQLRRSWLHPATVLLLRSPCSAIGCWAEAQPTRRCSHTLILHASRQAARQICSRTKGRATLRCAGSS